MKEVYIKRRVFPYFAAVMNYSRYNGEGVNYTAEVVNASVKLTFEKDITGNYFHSRHEKAKAVMAKWEAINKKDLQ